MGTNQVIYLDIAAHLRDVVAKSDQGDLLPSDAELCELFGVSRMTARQAVQLLVNEHLVERRRGKGTFVAKRPVPRALGSPLSFTESMRQRGLVASSRPLESRPAQANEDDAMALDIKVGAPVFLIERVRLADGVPMAIERAILPTDIAAELNPDVGSGSLHAAFETAGHFPAKAHAEVGARLSTEWEQEHLEIDPGTVVITEERTIFDQDERPLEHTFTVYAADRYSFSAVLYPHEGESGR